jgi:hypothetical protein
LFLLIEFYFTYCDSGSPFSRFQDPKCGAKRQKDGGEEAQHDFTCLVVH